MTRLSLFLAAFGFLTFLSVHAEARSVDFEVDNTPLLIDEEKGMELKFAGDREEGALEFFFKNDDLENDITDVTSDRLNAIAPAAGVQFKLVF